MLIKFKKPDPRAGQIARMDSSRGQHFIDSGAAVAIKEGSTDEGAPVTPPAVPDSEPSPAEQLVKANAADVIASLEAVEDLELVRAALEAEQADAGKKRKTVIEALTARVAALEQPQD